jgi:hypothetical protein
MADAPGFMLYKERGSLLECLSDDQAGRVIKATYAYAETGEVRDLDQGEMIVFMALKNDIDRSAKKYADICERNRLNVEKRWSKERPILSDGSTVTERIPP